MPKLYKLFGCDKNGFALLSGMVTGYAIVALVYVTATFVF